MPPYDLLNLRYVIYFLGIGCALSVLLILARGARTFSFTFRKRSQQEIDDDIHTFGSGVQERNAPLPLFMWVLILAFFIWAIVYTITTGRTGL